MSLSLNKILISLLKEESSTGTGAYIEPGSGEAVASKSAWIGGKKIKKDKVKESPDTTTGDIEKYEKAFKNVKMELFISNPSLINKLIAEGKRLEKAHDDEYEKDSTTMKGQEDGKKASRIYYMYSILENVLETIVKIK